MRLKPTAALAALAGALALAQPACASILYDFSFTDLGRGLPDFSLHFETPDYITVTGLAPVASQATPLSYDVLNFGENNTGWFLFSNAGGSLSDTFAFLSPTTFAFLPFVASADYDRAGVYTGGVQGNAGPAGGFFGNATLTVTDTSLTSGGVPEPAAWALMVAGFGLVGVSLRRRAAAMAA